MGTVEPVNVTAAELAEYWTRNRPPAADDLLVVVHPDRAELVRAALEPLGIEIRENRHLPDPDQCLVVDRRFACERSPRRPPWRYEGGDA